MLSEGSWLCCTSTSLLVSPVVVLAGVAAADPNSAISPVCGGIQASVVEAGVWRCWSLRELRSGKELRRVEFGREVATQWSVNVTVVNMQMLRDALVTLSSLAQREERQCLSFTRHTHRHPCQQRLKLPSARRANMRRAPPC